MPTLKQTFLENLLAGSARKKVSEAVDPDDREDGLVDGFNIPLDAQARALSARVKLPQARRLVALFSMAGVPGRYLNAEDAEGSIMAAADMLRKKASIRKAFLDLYDRLATAYGYQTPVEESIKRVVSEAEVTKRGNYIGKLFATVLIELGLPETLVGMTAPAAVQAGLLKTYTMIDQDTSLDRALRTLALRMGIKVEDVQDGVTEGLAVGQVKSSSSFATWKRQARSVGKDVWFDGDADICNAFVGAQPFKRGKTWSIGEWDGEKGEVCVTKKIPGELLKESVEVGQDEFAQEVVALVTALGIPEDILNLRRPQLIKALRTRKMTLTNRAQVQMMMGRLKTLLDNNTRQSAADEE